MNTIRAIIVDDEPDAILVLELLLQQYEHMVVSGTAQSVDEGIHLIEKLQPNLVFLDVEMPPKNGFQLLNAFPKPSFKVIFVTGFDHYAIKAFKYSALDYILKPISKSDLNETLERVNEQFHAEDQRLEQFNHLMREKITPDRIIINLTNGFKTLLLDEVVSIEAKSGNYAFFHLTNGRKLLCSNSLSHYQELLPEGTFYRVHRSHLINLSHVKAFDSKVTEVLLSNENKLSVAARRRSDFRKAIQAFSQSKGHA